MNLNHTNNSKKHINIITSCKNNCIDNLVTHWIDNDIDSTDLSTKEVKLECASNKDYIYINEIRELYGFNEKEQPIEWELFYKSYKTNYKFDKYFIKILYFHYLLVIGNYMSIHKFIIDFINSSSIQYFEKFVNSPLYIPIHKIGDTKYYNHETTIDKVYHLYPVTTCMMWNNKPELVRLLVSFETILYQTDNFGYYPEEAITHIPYFNPILYLEKFERYSIINERKCGENIYYRKLHEFKSVINEVKYISGEDVSRNWFYPI